MKQTILFFTDFTKQKVETCIRGFKKDPIILWKSSDAHSGTVLLRS